MIASQTTNALVETADPREPSFGSGREAAKMDGGKLRRWVSQLATFAVGQGLVQALNLVAGFLLIRWLTVEDYAAYSLVTGFQGTVGVLVELGFSSAIIALLAGRTDPSLVGGYIRSVRHYRTRIFLILLPIAAVGFPLLALRQGWNWTFTVVLLLAILGTLYLQSLATCYSIPLLVHQRLGQYYRTAAVLGGLRLATYLILHGVSLLTYVGAVFASSAVTLGQGLLYKRQSASHVVEPPTADRAMNQEVLDYIRPLIPSTVFFAFQGQITILLISWFGQIQNIAEVGALGRIGQLFAMLAAFNGVVVAPFIARTSRPLLLRRYGQMLAAAVGISTILTGVGFLFPRPFLWLLGSKYGHLETELGWMIASACLTYVTGVMFTMHSARKWIFKWGVWAYIAAVIAVQIAGIAFMDLSTTRNAILFSVYSAAATLLVQAAWGCAGFARNKESLETELQAP